MMMGNVRDFNATMTSGAAPTPLTLNQRLDNALCELSGVCSRLEEMTARVNGEPATAALGQSVGAPVPLQPLACNVERAEVFVKRLTEIAERVDRIA